MQRSYPTQSVILHELDKEVRHVMSFYSWDQVSLLYAWIIGRFFNRCWSQRRIVDDVIKVPIEVAATELTR